MKRLLFLTALLYITNPLLSQMTEAEVREIAQNGDEQQLVFESSRMLQEGYFFQAEILTDKLLELNSAKPNYNYRKGFIAMESRQAFSEAIPYLEIAVTDTDKNFDLFSANEKSASLDALYFLAKAYHMNEQLEKAREYYTKFIELSNKKSPLLPKAELGLKQCDVAGRLIKTPKTVRLENIGTRINTKYPDFSPVVSLDGSALYFTSKRPWENGESDAFRDPKLNQYPEDIYVSYRDVEGTWGEPTRLEISKADKNEATMAVSPDERRVYVYKDDVGYGDIYYSDFSTNKFSEIQRIKCEHSKLGTSYHCCSRWTFSVFCF